MATDSGSSWQIIGVLGPLILALAAPMAASQYHIFKTVDKLERYMREDDYRELADASNDSAFRASMTQRVTMLERTCCGP